MADVVMAHVFFVHHLPLRENLVDLSLDLRMGLLGRRTGWPCPFYVVGASNERVVTWTKSHRPHP